jgi:glycosyltransferase involved in cell wall biosynthesis
MSSVLHIVQTPLDRIGGPAVYIRELSKRLAKKGIEVGIVAPQSQNAKKISELQELGVNIYPVNNSLLPKSFLRAPWIFSLMAHKIIKKALDEYEVVNVHVESTFFQVAMGDYRDKRLVTTVHGFPLYEDLETLKFSFNIYKILHLMLIASQHTLTLSKLSKESHLVITLSNHLKNILIKLFNIDDQKLVTIPNGVDTHVFRPINPNSARSIVYKLVSCKCGKDIGNDLILLHVSRIEPCKGTDILVRAVSQLSRKDWFLLIVGSIEQPGYASHVKNLAERLGVLNKICMISGVPRNILPALYSASYVYILPSLFEGLPATILEAMACKTPVIATRVGGIPEVITNGYNGILLSPGSPGELKETIEYLIESPRTRDALATRAFSTSQFYSWENIAAKYQSTLSLIAH